jgi:prolyl-tRNA editing enzyme YbaK/EbsC (Cys-tRNA(Pro) deacylase)
LHLQTRAASGCDPEVVTLVLDRIRAWLRDENVDFREDCHEPTRTSLDSARARGEEMRVGGKALVIKVDETFCLFVLSAERKLDSQAIKRHFNARRTRFATPEELIEQTGLVPGSIPPFGEPILPFRLYVDPSVFENDRVAFNAGSLTHSMVLPIAEYKRVSNPAEIFRFSCPAD